MLSPFEMTVNALLDGVPITLNGITYKFFKKGDEVPLSFDRSGICEECFLGIERTAISEEGTSKKVYLGYDISFIDMITQLLKVSEEDGIYYASQNAFNKANKERRKRK